MGQQQLLFILLGILVVGIAIVISINLFRHNAVESKRDVLITESVNLATQAIEYYKKPANLGGGGNTFTGWSIPASMAVSENGSFIASVTPTNVEITGTGNEVVTGSDSIKVKITVNPDSYSTTVIN